MKWLEQLFVRKLKAALDLPKVNPIPRSGEDAERVNCYSVYVTDSDGSYLAERVEGDELVVGLWNEERRTHDIEKRLDLTNLDKLNFEIHHYHGLVTHHYQSIIEFLYIDGTGLYTLHSKYFILKYKVPKFIHGKRRLKRPDRLKALEAITNLVKDNHNQTFDSNRVLTAIYGSYTILHPQYPTLNQGMQLVLMSLQESGELEQVDSFNFRVRGTSLISLEHLQEERNKERRSVRQAKMMLWLTVVLAIATSFQAGLIKTSFYIDLDYVIDAMSRSLSN
ncbi:hypothetical protein [Vibrio sp. DNB22_12_1]